MLVLANQKFSQQSFLTERPQGVAPCREAFPLLAVTTACGFAVTRIPGGVWAVPLSAGSVVGKLFYYHAFYGICQAFYSLQIYFIKHILEAKYFKDLKKQMPTVEFCPYAFLDLRRNLKRQLSMDMKIILERMEKLGMDLAALNRRYCEIRQAKGDTSATPVNRRNMLAKAISSEGNPTLETFLDIVAALEGNVLIEWKDTTVERFGGVDDKPKSKSA